VIGIVFSFLLCGLVAVAGKRGAAPTTVLSRAVYGVRGNRLPSVISWMLTVGWETVPNSPTGPAPRGAWSSPE
jgi:purine-cytosine permease-like protein